MKKELNSMTKQEAELVFNFHTDGGHFNFPYWNGYHENGVGVITNSFKCHLLEANQDKLNKLFNVDYSIIPNPNIIYGYRHNKIFYLKKHAYKIRNLLKKKHNVKKLLVKGNLEEVCKKLNESLEVIYTKKYQL